MSRTRKPPKLDVGRADILPSGVYSIDWLRGALGIGYDGLRREIRAGRLRASQRCGKRFVLGEWLIEWLRAGELARTPPEK